MSYRQERTPTYATVKPNASSLFHKKNILPILKRTQNISSVPRTYLEFRDHLRKLEGKTFEIVKEYDDRIVLKYPEEMIEEFEPGRSVVSIDLEKYLVKKQ